VQASPLGRLLGVEIDRRGCVLVDQYLNPKNHPEIFICGDLAHVEEDGRQIPGTAQPAMQMGAHAAKLIHNDLNGEKRIPFHYFDKGDMATIGRKAAVAKVIWPFKAHLSGFLAWMVWLVIHISFLINFRSRLSVFRQWAYTYLFFKDGARLIVGSQNLPGWNEQQVEEKLDLNAPELTAKR
jgi:NADH dehydrogenase